MSTLADLKKFKSEYKEKMRKDGQAAFSTEMKKFFADNPDIEAIRWVQYTPHFNDGEPCVFRVREFEFKPVDKNEQSLIESDEYSSGPFLGGDYYKEEVKAIWDKYNKRVTQLEDAVVDNELMEMLFGDHCRVVATAEGFEVEEYNHD